MPEPDRQGKEVSPSFKSMELVDGIVPFTDTQKCYIKKWFPRMGVCVGVSNLTYKKVHAQNLCNARKFPHTPAPSTS